MNSEISWEREGMRGIGIEGTIQLFEHYGVAPYLLSIATLPESTVALALDLMFGPPSMAFLINDYQEMYDAQKATSQTPPICPFGASK